MFSVFNKENILAKKININNIINSIDVLLEEMEVFPINNERLAMALGIKIIKSSSPKSFFNEATKVLTVSNNSSDERYDFLLRYSIVFLLQNRSTNKKSSFFLEKVNELKYPMWFIQRLQWKKLTNENIMFKLKMEEQHLNYVLDKIEFTDFDGLATPFKKNTSQSIQETDYHYMMKKEQNRLKKLRHELLNNNLFSKKEIFII